VSIVLLSGNWTAPNCRTASWPLGDAMPTSGTYLADPLNPLYESPPSTIRRRPAKVMR